MSLVLAYYLRVKHATEDKWFEVGPNVSRWGFFIYKSSVEEVEKFFKSVGLQTAVEEFQIDYNDR
jgi:hypothetical protein